jgi:type IV pilus assembly protein PilP
VLLSVVLASFIIAGCSSGQSDLQKWIADTKKKPGGRIQPLPEVKPYETFVYSAGNMRSPFQPQGPGALGGGNAALRPNTRRNREFLEGFSLDTLKMVGTFKIGNSFYGLVQSKDGLVHKVQPGNYLGQNDGKVTDISGNKISLIEIIPDGLGGYIERPATLALSN